MFSLYFTFSTLFALAMRLCAWNTFQEPLDKRERNDLLKLIMEILYYKVVSKEKKVRTKKQKKKLEKT